MASSQPVAMHGRWQRLPSLLFGVAVHNFVPLLLDTGKQISGTTEDLNPHQVSSVLQQRQRRTDRAALSD